jgi:histidine phosphotransferase ChpT
MTETPDLTALIGSRICHDLISPIGAIGNGVELMMLDGAAQSPELILISESVANANARIRFLRVAFGAAGPEARIGQSEIQTILADVTRGNRLHHDWRSEADLSRQEVRLALLLAMCLETALPYGGTITTRPDGPAWSLLAEAPKLRIDPALWQVLGDGKIPPDVTPGQVHFALVPDLLKRLQRRLFVELSETRIHIRF